MAKYSGLPSSGRVNSLGAAYEGSGLSPIGFGGFGGGFSGFGTGTAEPKKTVSPRVYTPPSDTYKLEPPPGGFTGDNPSEVIPIEPPAPPTAEEIARQEQIAQEQATQERRMEIERQTQLAEQRELQRQQELEAQRRQAGTEKRDRVLENADQVNQEVNNNREGNLEQLQEQTRTPRDLGAPEPEAPAFREQPTANPSFDLQQGSVERTNTDRMSGQPGQTFGRRAFNGSPQTQYLRDNFFFDNREGVGRLDTFTGAREELKREREALEKEDAEEKTAEATVEAIKKQTGQNRDTLAGYNQRRRAGTNTPSDDIKYDDGLGRGGRR